MGAAYYIVLDKKEPGFTTSVNGKAVAREVVAISKITKTLKLPDINDFTSFATLAAEFGADPDSEGAKEKWFEAADGLKWVRAIRTYIDTHPRSVQNSARLLEDLEEYEAVLTKADRIRARWHFEMDI